MGRPGVDEPRTWREAALEWERRELEQRRAGRAVLVGCALELTIVLVTFAVVWVVFRVYGL